jgi:hypothetical protein
MLFQTLSLSLSLSLSLLSDFKLVYWAQSEKHWLIEVFNFLLVDKWLFY